MTCITFDLTIDGALADPMIAAAMRADRVDPRRFETLLRTTARALDAAPRRTLAYALPPDACRPAAPETRPSW